MTPPPATTTPNGTAGPNATTGGPQTTPGPASGAEETTQSLQWFHVMAGVLGLFVVVGGACYVTLMWQQNAIRNYKNNVEEYVKKIGLMRNDLAQQWQADSDGAGPARRTVVAAEEMPRAVTRVDDVAGDDGVPMLSTPGIGVGRIHAHQLRAAKAAREREEAAARELQLQLRRQAREAELEERRQASSGADLLGHAVREAVGVDRSIQTVERRAQWRSLRALEL